MKAIVAAEVVVTAFGVAEVLILVRHRARGRFPRKLKRRSGRIYGRTYGRTDGQIHNDWLRYLKTRINIYFFIFQELDQPPYVIWGNPKKVVERAF